MNADYNISPQKSDDMKILDIHTHRSGHHPEAVKSLSLHRDFSMPEFIPDQSYSIGIHPWDTAEEPSALEWETLEELAARPDVVAIGECGIDLLPKGGPLFRQLLVFRRQVELSEQLQKPLVVHDVKGHDVITGARRDLAPRQNWAIHGFRLRPEVADMFLRTGCYLSFGENFNPDTIRHMPEDRILAETDESDKSIHEIITRLSDARGCDLTEIIARNTAAFLRN